MAADGLITRSIGAGARAGRSTLRTLVVHLRLPFQLLLAPVFLWGALLGGGGGLGAGGLGWTAGLAFVVFHVFLYGGATAFNSYYDRDEGPVGGLERPPGVVPALLPFALAVKGTGWALAGLVNPAFFVVYGGFAALSLAYSHPRVRWKARPVASLAVVGAGQGVLAFLGGWAAVRGEVASAAGPVGVSGALAAALLVLGFYPLTQLYQLDEDRARGDRTVAVAWGPAACFRWALGCQALGGLAMVVLLAARYEAVDAALVGAGLLAQLLALASWARSFDADRILDNYRRVMRLNIATAGGLACYLGYRLLAG